MFLLLSASLRGETEYLAVISTWISLELARENIISSMVIGLTGFFSREVFAHSLC